MCPRFFFFHETATTEIYTLSHTTLFRSCRSRRAPKAIRRAVPSRWALRNKDSADCKSERLRARSSPPRSGVMIRADRSEEHTSELQSRFDLVCRLLLEKKKNEQARNNRG